MGLFDLNLKNTSTKEFNSFETERLIIRRLVPEDAETISFYRSLPEVNKFQSWDNYSIEKASELIEEMHNSDPSVHSRWFQFGVELKSSGKLIGDIGFLNTDEFQKSWIGFTLNHEYWRKGYAFESVQAVLEHYLRLGTTQIWASIDPKNLPSEKLLKKLAFNLVESKPKDQIYFKDMPDNTLSRIAHGRACFFEISRSNVKN